MKYLMIMALFITGCYDPYREEQYTYMCKMGGYATITTLAEQEGTRFPPDYEIKYQEQIKEDCKQIVDDILKN